MSQTSGERVLRLPPDPASASLTRQALRGLLVECGQQRWRGAAQVAVSELVTNVVLHVHTPLVLRVTCGREDGLSDWDSSTVSRAEGGLVGRRVVAIVPPQRRDAHVAGFTRHLTTGQAHALGVALELPVLTADGTQLICTFLIEAHGTPSGRTVHLFRITPKEAP